MRYNGAMHIFSLLAHFFVSAYISIASLVSPLHAPTSVLLPTQTPASATSTINTSTNTTTAPQVDTSATAQPQSLRGTALTPSAIPLGDDKYTTSGPKKGYVYVCHVAQGGQGAQGSASWIHGSTWDPSAKVAVSGSVSWPNAAYTMTISGNMRHISANGLPTDHPTGTFPIARSDPAHQFDGNPNSIKAQTYSYSLPVSPMMLATPDCIFGQVGIMQDGVPLFDGFDAEYRDAVAHETQDTWEGHPDEAGVYHYHGFESRSMLSTPLSTVVGFAFDGYPITGPALPDGSQLSSADLDECHGITSTIELDGKAVQTYHYVLTQDFPYSVACFRGTSYEPKPGSGQNGTQSHPQGAAQPTDAAHTPPQPAIDACSGKATGASCSFQTPSGTLSGTCETPPGASLACVPSH